MGYQYKLHKNRAGTYKGLAVEYLPSERCEVYSVWSMCDESPQHAEYGVQHHYDLGLIKASSRDNALEKARKMALEFPNGELFDCSVLFMY